MVTKDSFTTLFDLPKQITAGKILKGTVQVTNIGGKQIEKLNVNIVSSPYPFQASDTGSQIPPFGSISIPVSIKIPILFHKSQGVINVSINGEQATFQFEILPTFWLYGVIGCFALSLILIIWTFIRKT